MSGALYVVHADDSENTMERVGLLGRAAEARGVRLVALNARTADYTALPELGAGDMLFNCGRGGGRLETLLWRPGVATLREPSPRWVVNEGDTTVFTAVHERLGLPGPKTVHHLPDDDELLRRYVAAVSGPPVIFKAFGRTRGVGVIYCGDWPAILSTADYLRTLDAQFLIREYVPHEELLRVMVLGGRVLCALRHPRRPGDVRSTIDGTYEVCPEVSEDVATLAIRALEACEYEFGGADIIEHPERGPLLLEVNPPSNFASIERRTGVDVAGALVEHLLAKARASVAESGSS